MNRVFDSSGPEGKVRGTPQQIIDKYNQLARDAQLANDRVATENFQQHAEHYLRLLGEAQREQEARREEQERQNRERQAERDRERLERQEREAAAAAASAAPQDPAEAPQPDVLDMGAGDDSGLVETPESKPKKTTSSTRKPRSTSSSSTRSKSTSSKSTASKTSTSKSTKAKEADAEAPAASPTAEDGSKEAAE